MNTKQVLFDNLKSGWKISIFIYNFLMKHIKLFIFPLLSAICIIFTLKTSYKFSDIHSPIELTFIWSIAYFLTLFFAIFFNVATIFMVNQYLSHTEASIIKSIRFSFSKISSILIWTLISGSVGVLLKILENIEERFYFPIFSSLLEITWAMMSYFVVPVICFKSAVRPSALMKETKTIIKAIWERKGHITKIASAGLINLLLFFVICLLANIWSNSHNSLLNGLCIFTIIFLLMLIVLAETTLKAIFYRYLTEDYIPEDVNPSLLESRLNLK